MKKLKFIEETKMNFDEITTGIIKVVSYLNGKKSSERIIDSKDDSVHYLVEQMSNYGERVKIYHQIIVTNSDH